MNDYINLTLLKEYHNRSHSKLNSNHNQSHRNKITGFLIKPFVGSIGLKKFIKSIVPTVLIAQSIQ